MSTTTSRTTPESWRKGANIVLDRISEIVFECNHQGLLSYLNPAWADQLGFSVEQSLHHPLIDFAHEEDRDSLSLAVTLADTGTQNLELRLHDADGHARWFTLAVRGGVAAGTVVGTLHNIDRRKTIESELQERTKLALLSAEVNGALNRQGPVRAVLQMCAEILQQHLDAVLFRIWTMDDTSTTLELQASAGLYTHIDGAHSRIKVGLFKIGRIAGLRAPHLTNEFVTDPHISDPAWARREGIVAFAGYPLIVEERVTGVMAAFSRRPLTEAVLRTLGSKADSLAQFIDRRRTEAELRRALETARSASRAKSDFLANMSHEVRTPIAAIMSYSELLLDSRMDYHERNHALRSIRRNGKHLLHLINDILDLSKIEAGQLALEQVEASPWTLLHEVVTALILRAQEKGVRLDLFAEGRVPRSIITDPTRLRQILFNLVANAVKFTESTHHVWIRLSADEASDPPRLIVRVQDEGIGISADKMAELFTPFHQGDMSTTRRYGGTGLGLSISRRLALALGGAIRVESEAGKGSTFTLDLPLHGSVEWVEADQLAILTQGPTPRRPTQPLSGNPMRVLLVEDSKDNQYLLTYMLAKLGLIVDVADNGRVGMEKALAAHYDIIIMDMQMPELDGYDATRHLRQQGYNRPIVALTAHAMKGDRDRCLEAGCDEYLTKPTRKEDLRDTIARLAPRDEG